MNYEVVKVCPVCGKEFKTTDGKRKYCSGECSKIAKSKYDKKYQKTHKRQAHEYNKKYRRKCKELGVFRLFDFYDDEEM